MSATPKGPDARTAYLATLREKLIAKRDGGDVITPSTVIAAPTFTLAPAPPTVVHPDVKPENVVVSEQPCPYSQAEPFSASTRPDDHHVELAGLASALATVAERLSEVARALRGEA